MNAEKEKRIKQGYEIIENCIIGNTEIVIGHCPAAPNPYVCWYCKDGNNYYWGYYCNSYEKAREKLIERCQSECGMPYNRNKQIKKCEEHER